MISTRRQFLIQSAKAALAVAAGVLGGVAIATRPKPTYEVPAEEWGPGNTWMAASRRFLRDRARLASEITEADRQYTRALTERLTPLTHDEKREALQRHLATQQPLEELREQIEVPFPSIPNDGEMHNVMVQWDGWGYKAWIDGERVDYVPNA